MVQRYYEHQHGVASVNEGEYVKRQHTPYGQDFEENGALCLSTSSYVSTSSVNEGWYDARTGGRLTSTTSSMGGTAGNPPCARLESGHVQGFAYHPSDSLFPPSPCFADSPAGSCPSPTELPKNGRLVGEGALFPIVPSSHSSQPSSETSSPMSNVVSAPVHVPPYMYPSTAYGVSHHVQTSPGYIPLSDPADYTMHPLCGLEHQPNNCSFQHNPYAPAAFVVTPPPTPTPSSVQEVRTAPSTPPPEPAPTGPPCTWDVVIEFKHGRQAPYTSEHPKGTSPVLGKEYIVEGDRGHDLGRLMSAKLAKKEKCKAPASKKKGAAPPKVLREATADEVLHWKTSLDDLEKSLLPKINKIVEAAGLNLTITNVSYQFDFKKLTFYYTSPEPQPDFRSILSDCYSFWKCRIWLTSLPRTRAAAKATLPAHI
eukprot:gene21664-33345_t